MMMRLIAAALVLAATAGPIELGARGEAGRYLHTPLPKDGLVDLDFNRAYNPPCAFTAFATCPLPVKQNQLAVAIRAGELRPH